MTLEAIRYKDGQMTILDQLLLPIDTVYIPVKDTNDGWTVIKKMQVRGAPAIGVVGSLSLACEIYPMEFLCCEDLVSHVTKKLDYLVTARPTAVNMKDSRDKLIKLMDEWTEKNKPSAAQLKQLLIRTIEDFLKEDVNANRAMGNYGADHILKHCPGDGQVTILTHCNTGSLATAGFGTALGVVRTLHERKQLSQCYCTETRPYNQGARLTAYELVTDKIPSTLICDSMVAALMKRKQISAVALGADRVVANGDTANKIGTYQIAVLAKYHNVPFYVVAPHTSIDLNLMKGDDIVIEERPHQEMTHVKGVQLAPEGINCWNPAFDVTPAELITGGIVTEFGVFQPNELQQKLQEILVKRSF